MQISIKKIWSVLLVFCLICTLVPVSEVHAADEQVKAGIAATPQTINEDEVVNMDIALLGIPYQGKVIPNDVILVIDRSGSMTSYKTDLLNSARQFINMVDLSTHRIGIVDYDDKVESFPISQDANQLLEYIDAVESKTMGGTSIHLGVDEAVNLLKGKRDGATGAIVLMTDGQSNETLALEAAEKAKARGYTFFTVALCSSETGSANVLLKKMATSEADHYYVWPSSGLPDVYQEISQKIGYANAKDVVITQKISDQFELVAGSTDSNIPLPTINGQWIIWDITQLGEGESHLTYQLKVKDGVKAGTYNHSSAGNIVYTTYSGASANINLPAQAITVNNYALTLNAVTPTEYGIVGGETVTITGAHIKSNAVVTVGGTKISNAVITGDSQITFTMPAHAQGTDAITVTNPDGQTASLAVQFKATPVITAVSPQTGPYEGGTKVKITTQNVMTGATVTFDGVPATVESISNGVVTVVNPKINKSGAVDVTIINPDGTTVTAPSAFTYEVDITTLPVITSMTPNQGAEKKSVKVTLTGQNLKDSTVTVGGVKVTLLTNTDTKLIFRVPNTFAASVQDVVVTNRYKGSATTQYTYGAIAAVVPTVTSVNPASGDELDNPKVTIEGTNFKSPTVTVGGVQVTLLTSTSTKLIFRVPDTFAASTQNVVITNSDGQSVTTQYTYNPLTTVVVAPVINSVIPSNGEELKAEKVTITGENLKGATVTVGGVGVTLLTDTDTKLIFRVPDTFAASVQDIVITDSNGNSTTAQYTYTAPIVVATVPVINSVTPNSGEELKAEKVTISGENLKGSTVTVGGVAVTLLTDTDNTLIFRVPDTFAASTQSIVVTDSNGNSTTAQYTYTAPIVVATVPVINSVTPNSGEELKAEKVTISGENLKGSTVTVGGVAVTLLTDTDNTLVFRVPDSFAAGTQSIVVTDSNGNSVTAQYTYEAVAPAVAPVINDITPNTGIEGDSQKVTITGSNFNTSGIKVTVDNGSTSEVISTMLTLQSDKLIFRIPALSAGTYTVTVTNADGQSATCTYTVS